MWETLIDAVELEKFGEQLHTTETEVNQMKKFSLPKKMDKAVEMNKLQQQVVALRTQQQ